MWLAHTDSGGAAKALPLALHFPSLERDCRGDQALLSRLFLASGSSHCCSQMEALPLALCLVRDSNPCHHGPLASNSGPWSCATARTDWCGPCGPSVSLPSDRVRGANSHPALGADRASALVLASHRLWGVQPGRADRPPPCTSVPKCRDLDYKPCQMVMILPQVHLRKPCYDFYFL